MYWKNQRTNEDYPRDAEKLFIHSMMMTTTWIFEFLVKIYNISFSLRDDNRHYAHHTWQFKWWKKNFVFFGLPPMTAAVAAEVWFHFIFRPFYHYKVSKTMIYIDQLNDADEDVCLCVYAHNSRIMNQKKEKQKECRFLASSANYTRV